MKHPGVSEDKEKKRIWGQRSWDERIAQHFKAHELSNVAKEKILGHEAYIGVSDEKFWDSKDEYPSGYYKTSYAIKRGKDFAVQILIFDGNHDPGLTEHSKLKGRVNKTIREATGSIQLGIKGGMYEK